MGDYADLLDAQHATPAPRRPRASASPATPRQAPPLPAVAQPTDPPQDQPTGRSLGRSTGKSTGLPTDRPVSRVVDRPKAFYITERLDRRLDEAVRYLQTRHGIRKVDRSILVTALLDDGALWTDEALDRLVGRVVDQLTGRLTGR